MRPIWVFSLFYNCCARPSNLWSFRWWSCVLETLSNEFPSFLCFFVEWRFVTWWLVWDWELSRARSLYNFKWFAVVNERKASAMQCLCKALIKNLDGYTETVKRNIACLSFIHLLSVSQRHCWFIHMNDERNSSGKPSFHHSIIFWNMVFPDPVFDSMTMSAVMVRTLWRYVAFSKIMVVFYSWFAIWWRCRKTTPWCHIRCRILISSSNLVREV